MRCASFSHHEGQPGGSTRGSGRLGGGARRPDGAAALLPAPADITPPSFAE